MIPEEINIEPKLYTIEEAAKLLGTSNARADFIKTHVLRRGLRLTRIPIENDEGRVVRTMVRVSSIELTRYILAHTAPEK